MLSGHWVCSHKYNNMRAFSGRDWPDNKQNTVNNQNSFLKSPEMFRLFKPILLKTADFYGYTTVKHDTCTYVNTKFPFSYNHGNSHQKRELAVHRAQLSLPSLQNNMWKTSSRPHQQIFSRVLRSELIKTWTKTYRSQDTMERSDLWAECDDGRHTADPLPNLKLQCPFHCFCYFKYLDDFRKWHTVSTQGFWDLSPFLYSCDLF